MCLFALLATPVSLQQQPAQKTAAQSHLRFAIVQNDKVGFIDESGTVIIKPQFGDDPSRPSYFSEGLALVNSGGKSNYIDESGKTVLSTAYRAGPFSEGLAVVCVPQTRADKNESDVKCGFMDESGRIVIKPQFDKADQFHDGMARFWVYEGNDSDSREKVGFIDKEGRVVVEPVFDNAYWFSEGLANVALVNGQRAYIDKTGKVVSNPDYDYTFAWFSEGLAPAKKGDKWGYVSKEFVFVIEPKFDYVAQAFSDGLAHVRVDGKFGFIDVTGRMVIPPQFENPANFSEGMAAIQVGQKYGYIDRAGKLVIEPVFTEVRPFKGGLAAVTRDDGVRWLSCGCWSKWDYIDKTGKTVWEYNSQK
jgi:hypothetical protein